MKKLKNNRARLLVLMLFLIQMATSIDANACACGCGVFDVGTSLLHPSGAGGMVYLEYDFMNQNKNWHTTHSAPEGDNADKVIKTSYTTLGSQYFFDRNYGIQIDVPYVSRHFETADPDTGTVGSFDHASIGDIRLKGVYTGFSEDMSTGLTFGVKLPTGPTNTPNFDYDTQIGTGTTDLLVGIYHMNALSSDQLWTGFYQVSLDQPILTQNNYIAGNEIDTVYGVYYHGISFSPQSNFIPMLQVKGTLKGSDHGVSGHSEDTGYMRLMVAPAFEISFGSFKIYADVSVPFYQYFSGNQLVPNYLFKSLVAYNF